MSPGELRPVLMFSERFREKLAAFRELDGVFDPADTQAKSEAREMSEHLRRCGLPKKSIRYIEEVGLEFLCRRQSGIDMRDFLASTKQVAIITGVPGSGKTTLCALAFAGMTRRVDQWDAIAREIVPGWELDASGCAFFSARQLARLHQGFSEHQAAIEALERISLLVLNDLGMESAEDSKMQEKTESLLCERDEQCLRTIITTNLQPEEIAERYGQRVASRFAQEARVISCGALDFRRQAKEATR